MRSNLRTERPIGYLIHEVARMMRRRFEDEARTHGLTLAQWRALGAIDSEHMITQVALASHIDADPMTVSGILDRLEKRGLLERYPHPNDSRAKLSRLTPDGVEMVAAARHLGKTLYDAALDGLDEAERQALISSLSRMRDNLNNTDQMAEQQEAV
ncbi:MarR family winged helix-turn-helix transcriptional regulator [Devosia psychrophila]|uniref:DNA-binding transcriptional regulator, MarR family n=1 Tax=Devosia psychrophila TaxID=728005 RepID=A0A0F5Q3N1_9HYPH|nr:MarR family transcriptional regulator [Devosia psychrophila]KKC34674.1 hypothetical protein WH91_01325 [Devosia psychrophila]SFC88579.1 DNA-binding transcriptional regulator, MarR family [Devosia psychrophila]